MDTAKQLADAENNYDAYAEAAANSSWTLGLETDAVAGNAMVTIFQRGHVEVSEDDELADLELEAAAQKPPTPAATCPVYLCGELSAASLPRVNRFRTKWLKQASLSGDAPKQQQQQQPLDECNSQAQ